MTNQHILPQFQQLLTRQIGNQIHFNDVFTDHQVDFDAILTVAFRNLGRLQDQYFSIGQNPNSAIYGINLVHDLIKEQARLSKEIRNHQPLNTLNHLPDLEKEAIISVINCAPRSSTHTQSGQNGQDFHLAITSTGLEIYSVPLDGLASLEARNQILALYRIPTAEHQFFNGQHEQFRSSIIVTTRYCPEILQPIFQYQSQTELLAAKANKAHPQAIPPLPKARLAYLDKFGNARLEIADPIQITKLSQETTRGQSRKLQINQHIIEAHFVNSLKEIPNNQLGFYYNVADQQDNQEANPQPIYLELVKKSDLPNQETQTAGHLLNELDINQKSDQFTFNLL